MKLTAVILIGFALAACRTVEDQTMAYVAGSVLAVIACGLYEISGERKGRKL